MIPALVEEPQRPRKATRTARSFTRPRIRDGRRRIDAPPCSALEAAS
jgi:hypothetical protein